MECEENNLTASRLLVLFSFQVSLYVGLCVVGVCFFSADTYVIGGCAILFVNELFHISARENN